MSKHDWNLKWEFSLSIPALLRFEICFKLWKNLPYHFGYGVATHNSRGPQACAAITIACPSVASITCWFEKKSVRKRFFCNISHRQVLTRTQCNSCCHSLGSLIIFFVKIKTQTKNRFYVYDTLYLLIKESISLQDFKFGFAIKDIYFPGFFFVWKKTQKKDLDKRNIRAWFVKICEQRTKLPSWHLHLNAPVKLKSKIFFCLTAF